MAPHVAVIGAGPLGLMSVKNLKEDGFQVTGFEKRGYVGGLWKAANDSSISVVPGTVFNSSRFRSALSDYPFPDDIDDFPTSQQLWNYFQSYANHFDLTEHIRLNAEIKNVDRVNGRWALSISYNGTDHLVTEYFDKLLVANGSFVTPKMPTLNGFENFKGLATHSLQFDWTNLHKFDGQNVLIIGMHATATDVVCELFSNAKKIYLSHRHGILLLPRYGPDGRSYDQAMSLDFLYWNAFASRWFPGIWNWLVDSMVQKMSKAAYPKAKTEWNLLPAPSMATTPPIIADRLWPHLESGFAEPCSDVKRITGPKTVELTDGKIITDIDTIIYCTGFDFAIPFMAPEFNPYPIIGETSYLYRNTFAMHEDSAVRNSLAFVGHVALPLPGFVNYELQTMAISQTWLGRSTLPSLSEMKAWHTDHLNWRKWLLDRQKTKSTFYVVFVSVGDHLQWLDKTAGTGLYDHFGWFKWRAWRLWWQDKELYRKCKSGILSPAIFRLFDMGRRRPWAGARERILLDNEIADRAQKKRVEMMKREAEEQKTK